jgi:5-oxoprolinase (ATP-hydrolysing) subunit A
MAGGGGRLRLAFVSASRAAAARDVRIGALQALAHAAGSTVSYVKPHGALYNTVAIDGSVITITVESICVQGDSLGSVKIAATVLQRLVVDGVDLKPFT